MTAVQQWDSLLSLSILVNGERVLTSENVAALGREINFPPGFFVSYDQSQRRFNVFLETLNTTHGALAYSIDGTNAAESLHHQLAAPNPDGHAGFESAEDKTKLDTVFAWVTFALIGDPGEPTTLDYGNNVVFLTGAASSITLPSLSASFGAGRWSPIVITNMRGGALVVNEPDAFTIGGAPSPLNMANGASVMLIPTAADSWGTINILT